MKPRLIFVVLSALFLVGNEAAINKYKVQNTIELLQAIETILWHGQSDPKNLMQIPHEIQLEPGFYKIPNEESILLNYRKFYIRRALSSQLNQDIQLSVNYPWPYQKELIFSQKLPKLLLTLHEELRKGMKFSREILYVVHSPFELPEALKKASENKQDTTIRLPYCEKPQCLHRPDIIEDLKRIRMMADDGMRLRIKSKSFSLDQNKFLFFEKHIDPFVSQLEESSS